MEKFYKKLVHPFATLSAYYLYSAGTNKIIRVPKPIYDFFKNDTILDENHSNLLRSLYDSGSLCAECVQAIEHPSTQHMESILKNKIQHITLQITQKCNLRCKYCVYSGAYDTRTHSKDSMTLERGKQSIDFLVARSSGIKRLNIGFYGGEPLVEFSLMEELTEYAVKKAEGKQVSFNITTNGTIITDEILTFFEKYNFGILISLDGPKEIHDKNRVFATTGQGSFDKIMANIKKIKEQYPSVYKNISFNAVIDTSLDTGCTNDFFIKCEELEGANITASIISSEFKKSKVVIPDSYWIETEVDKFKVLLRKFKRLGSDKVSQIAEQQFEELKSQMVDLRNHTFGFPAKAHPGGPCLPGARKLFADIDGNLYPCERVSESSSSACIGHLDSGFDMKSVDAMLNIGRLTEKECKECWAFRMCTQCVVAADTSTTLSREKKLSHCEDTFARNEELLKDYCTLLELGFNFDSDIRNLSPIFSSEGR